MEQLEEKGKFQKWLELLQQESWQLELIISGFTIFLLLGLYDPLLSAEVYLRKLSYATSGFGRLQVPFVFIKGAWYSVVLNLIIHVVLRGLWIATIGLRYVSQDIDFKSLNFAPKFHNHLKKRIISFDNYIEWLEKICSVVFAFTFLIVFMWIALAFWLTFTNVIVGSLSRFVNDLPIVGEYLSVPLLLSFLVLSLIYFIDFVGMGVFKKVREISKFYFPIYLFFNFITLSFIYRPLYYNLIDNEFGKWVGYLLVPYLCTIMLISGLVYETHSYMPKLEGTIQYLKNDHYDDIIKAHKVTNRPSIPSKTINRQFLELFIPYNPRYEDGIIEIICPDLKRTNNDGLNLSLFVSRSKKYDIEASLACFDQLHRIYIDDSLQIKNDFLYYVHPERNDKGLLKMINMETLDAGRHDLRIESQRFNFKDSIVWEETALIPFWLERLEN